MPQPAVLLQGTVARVAARREHRLHVLQVIRALSGHDSERKAGKCENGDTEHGDSDAVRQAEILTPSATASAAVT